MHAPVANPAVVAVAVICGSDEPTLMNCLAALKVQQVALHLTVIDNGVLSSDSQVASALAMDFPDSALIRNPKPLGFSANNNSVIRQLPASIRAVLLLNDDTLMQPGALANLLALLDSAPDIGAVAPRLAYPDGTFQRTASRFPHGLHGVLHALTGKRPPVLEDARQGKFWLRGVCLLLRAEALQQVGMLDEGYDPGYAEDIDLCYRLARRGWRLRICREATVVHLEGKSFGKKSTNWYRQSFRGLFRFIAKSYPPRQQLALKAAWTIGTAMRLCASAFLHALGIRGRLGEPAAYSGILKDLIRPYIL